jgi:hypothetical protein
MRREMGRCAVEEVVRFATVSAAQPCDDRNAGDNDMSESIAVKSVVLHRVRVPFVEPFRISNGVVAEKDAILIELATEEGIVGWGEASPMSGSFYSARRLIVRGQRSGNDSSRHCCPRAESIRNVL